MRLPFKKKWLGLAIAALVITVPLVIRAKSSNQGKLVDIATVAQQDIRPTILASGVLAYREEVALTAEVTAKVKDLLVAEGDDVKKGQVLLRLDPESYRNAIEREDATRRQNLIGIERQSVALELRRKQYERTKKLFEAHMVDSSKFDEERNQLQLAEVELKSTQESLKRANAVLADAHEQLSKTEVRAPISGRVVALPIKVGETAIPSTMSMNGAQLMTIADTSSIKAELKVDEGDIAKIAIGQSVSIYAAAYPEKALKGQVEKIALSPSLDNQARAYKVTTSLTAPADYKLRSGMSNRAEIFLSDGQKRAAVPVEAIINEDKDGKETKHFVVAVKEGKAQKIEVTLGQSDDKWQEITKGLAAGEQFVSGPSKVLRDLKTGEKVSQKPADDKKDKKDKKDDKS